MLIVGLNGSPRLEGNTARLLSAALEAAREAGAETIMLHVNEALKGVKTPFCVQCSERCEAKCCRGTLMEEYFSVLRRADGLLVASPVYFGTASGQLKAFWDKTRILRRERALVNVVGGALAVGSARFGGQENVLNSIYHMMLVQGMTIVGDGLEEADSGHHGACGRSPVENDEEAFRRARILSLRVLQVAEATKGLRQRLRRGEGR